MAEKFEDLPKFEELKVLPPHGLIVVRVDGDLGDVERARYWLEQEEQREGSPLRGRKALVVNDAVEVSSIDDPRVGRLRFLLDHVRTAVLNIELRTPDHLNMGPNGCALCLEIEAELRLGGFLPHDPEALG